MSTFTTLRHAVRAIATTLIVCCAIAEGALAEAPMPQAPAPSLITRIKMVTVAGPDIAKLEAAYSVSMGYVTRERGKVSQAQSKSWGVPRMAGRPFVLMSSTGTPDVFIRLVQIDPVPQYQALTSSGWNAFEFIVDDLTKLRKTFDGSTFDVIEEPHSFGGAFASEAAMTARGPAQEVLYLTTENGDREKSTFLIPKSQVDRPFVVILGGADFGGMRDFYATHFKMKPGAEFQMKIEPLEKAQGLPPDNKFKMMVVFASQKNNMIEIDGLPAAVKPRPASRGQLVPGNAMVSFGVENLDDVKLKLISLPKKLYGDHRAASFVGPAGELVELIEETAR